jgi:hypothetical protein
MSFLEPKWMLGGMPLDVAMPAADVFSLAPWAAVSRYGSWRFWTGDFTGRGRLDICAFNSNNGDVIVGPNTGSSFDIPPKPTRWASLGEGNWSFFSFGDFTGRGRLDICAFNSNNGDVIVGPNTGSSFDIPPHPKPWASLSRYLNWSFFSFGDFTGRGRLDICAFNSNNRDVIVGPNTGSSFDIPPKPTRWASLGDANWSLWTGDFAGHGRLDICAFNHDNGDVIVGPNTGSSFDIPPYPTPWARVSDNEWSFSFGDFDGDGRIDIVGYAPKNGSLWVGRNVGDQFYFGQAPWGSMNPPDGWTIVPGLFTNSGRTDILGFHARSGSFSVAANAGLRPEGYAWPLSASPGKTVDFMISGVATSKVDFFRHKAGAGGVTSIPMGSTNFVPGIQAAQAHSWKNGAGWKRSFKLKVPRNWPSGIYSARLTSATRGDHSHVTFVIKPDPDKRHSSVAVLANINTWLAYNSWSGRGKYTSPPAAHVSFLRPAPDTDPVREDDGTFHQTRAELWILGWLQDQGYHPDVYTDLDFHNGLPEGYRKLVVGTHAEYWSKQMYERLTDFLGSGGSLIYLGGNGIFEVGTYYADQTGIVFLNGCEGGPREPAFFRNQKMPELSLLGVATDPAVSDVDGLAYVVRHAEHPLFAGTGLKNGDQFGRLGLNTGKGKNGMASGWEVDTSNGPAQCYRMV